MKITHNSIKALIYCRVSSEKQVTEGHGLDSQEQRCEEYCKRKGYTVYKKFKDEGVSGKLYARPGIDSLKAFLKEQLQESFVVVFDDLDRLSRDLMVYISLKVEIENLGARFECPSFNFNDSPESKLIENVKVSIGEYERLKNAERVKNRMKARTERGYWSLCPPDVYKYTTTKEHGKLLVRNEPLASIWKEGLELYAKDVFYSVQELRRFVIEMCEKHNITDHKPSTKTVERYLNNILLTGHIEYPQWDIPLIKAHHEAIIDLQTHQKCLDKLYGRKRITEVRKDYREDFFLRGHLDCIDCGKPLTASWSKGRSKRYPYYTCRNSLCALANKGLKQEDVHECFFEYIETTKISNKTKALVTEIFNDVAKSNSKEFLAKRADAEKEVFQLNNEIDTLTKRIAQPQLIGKGQLIETYENAITKALNRKKELEKEVCFPTENGVFENALKEVLEDIANPQKAWTKYTIQQKNSFLSMYFDGNLVYEKNYGFRTANLNECINILKTFDTPKSHMVEMAGIEPAC